MYDEDDHHLPPSTLETERGIMIMAMRYSVVPWSV
jgi:hypothetical protein